MRLAAMEIKRSEMKMIIGELKCGILKNKMDQSSA